MERKLSALPGFDVAATQATPSHTISASSGEAALQPDRSTGGLADAANPSGPAANAARPNNNGGTSMSYAPVANFYSRRHSRRALIGGVIAASLARATASAVSAESAGGGRTYLAALPNGMHVAIVVNSWEASAFVTDGAGQAEAFTGAAGRSMTLEGANGAQLSASFGLEGFEGHVALEDGSGFDFLASEATGLAGVYDVEIGDSYIAGTAEHGAMLTGGIAHRLENGSLLVQGISTRPGSRSRSLSVRLAPESWGIQRWIVHESGAVAGGCGDSQGYGFAASIDETV